MAVFYKYQYTNKRKNIHPCFFPTHKNEGIFFSPIIDWAFWINGDLITYFLRPNSILYMLKFISPTNHYNAA